MTEVARDQLLWDVYVRGLCQLWAGDKDKSGPKRVLHVMETDSSTLEPHIPGPFQPL